MNILNHLEDSTKRSTQRERKEEVSVLIGKAWPKEDGGFSIAPLSEPVEGKKGEFKIASCYPLVVTEYCRIGFGTNKKCDPSKNQNTHWVFLNIEKDRIEEYKEICKKIA